MFRATIGFFILWLFSDNSKLLPKLDFSYYSYVIIILLSALEFALRLEDARCKMQDPGSHGSRVALNLDQSLQFKHE